MYLGTYLWPLFLLVGLGPSQSFAGCMMQEKSNVQTYQDTKSLNIAEIAGIQAKIFSNEAELKNAIIPLRDSQAKIVRSNQNFRNAFEDFSRIAELARRIIEELIFTSSELEELFNQLKDEQAFTLNSPLSAQLLEIAQSRNLSPKLKSNLSSLTSQVIFLESSSADTKAMVIDALQRHARRTGTLPQCLFQSLSSMTQKLKSQIDDISRAEPYETQKLIDARSRVTNTEADIAEWKKQLRERENQNKNLDAAISDLNWAINARCSGIDSVPQGGYGRSSGGGFF
jgi:hypothetical protein